MPRVCTVCTHPEREAIDRTLVGREPNRRIATQHGLTEAALRRHKADHISAGLLAAKRAEDAAAADDLLAQVRELRDHALDILLATKDGEGTDYRVALGAIREARACVELFVKVRESQELADRVAALEAQLGAGAGSPEGAGGWSP